MTTAEEIPIPEVVGHIEVSKEGAEIQFARPALRGKFGMRAAIRQLAKGGHDLVTMADAIAYADARCAKLQAERDALAEKVRSIADHCRDIYAIVPRLPIEADTMDAATDALHAFCLMLGIEGIDIEPTYKKDAAIDAAGGDQA